MHRRNFQLVILAICWIAHPLLARDLVIPPDVLSKIEAGEWAAARTTAQNTAAADRTPGMNYALAISLTKLASAESSSIARDTMRKEAHQILVALIQENPTRRDVALATARLALDAQNSAMAEPAVKFYPADAAVLRLAGLAAVTDWATAWNNIPAHQNTVVRERVEKQRAASRAFAESCLTRAVLLGDQNADTLRWLAKLRADAGQWRDAVLYYDQAEAIAPLAWNVLAERAEVLVLDARVEEAAADMEIVRTIISGPQLALIERRLGNACVRINDFACAVNHYSAALRLDPPMRLIRRDLARAAFADGQYDLALWAYGQSHHVDGRSLEDQIGFAACLYHMGRQDRARAHLEDIARKLEARPAAERDKPAAADYYLYRGRLAWDAGDLDAAIPDLTKAFEAAPRNRAYAIFLHQAQLAAGDLHASIETARRHGMEGDNDDLEAARFAVLAVLEKWPRPRPEDMLARKPPHLLVANAVLARFAAVRQDWAGAAGYWRAARLIRGRIAEPDAAWALLHHGDVADAEACFQDLQRFHGAARARDWARMGLACIDIARKSGTQAAEWVSKIEDLTPVGEMNRDAILHAASHHGGPATEIDDPFVKLGVLVFPRSNGAIVHAILPSSPLLELEFPLLPGDRLIRINGVPVATDADVRAFREHTLTDGPITVVIRRRGQTFEQILPATALKRNP